jgi:hypothetical protein
MTLPEKYDFKMVYDQGGNLLPERGQEHSEITLINLFEKVCLRLKQYEKDSYSMLELGSNQAFYSLAFKHIIGKDKTINIMLEPDTVAMKRGKANFEKNKCLGQFIDGAIGLEVYRLNLETKYFTINDILKDNNLNELDILHCDIDTAEVDMINTNIEIFKNKKIRHIFILTHSLELHQKCKEILVELGYFLEYEEQGQNIGGDGLLIFNVNADANV